MFSFVWDVLFPKRCVNCQSWGEFLCEACWEEIEFIRFQRCPACRETSVLGFTNHGCGKRTYLDQLYSLCHYRGSVRSLINQFKFAPTVTQLAEVIDEIMRRSFVGESVDQWHGVTIVPVPLHAWKKNERGFNQSEVIARILLKNIPNSIIVDDLLVRTQMRPPQSSLARKDRRSNIRGSFVVSPGWQKQSVEKILLVDDVYTSGATLKECARTINRNLSVEKVFGFTLARG